MKLVETFYQRYDWETGEDNVTKLVKISFEDSDEKTEAKIQFLEGEPEDMTFGRDLSDVFYITDMIKKAYELGRKGKPLEFEERIVKDE